MDMDINTVLRIAQEQFEVASGEACETVLLRGRTWLVRVAGLTAEDFGNIHREVMRLITLTKQLQRESKTVQVHQLQAVRQKLPTFDRLILAARVAPTTLLDSHLGSLTRDKFIEMLEMAAVGVEAMLSQLEANLTPAVPQIPPARHDELTAPPPLPEGDLGAPPPGEGGAPPIDADGF